MDRPKHFLPGDRVAYLGEDEGITKEYWGTVVSEEEYTVLLPRIGDNQNPVYARWDEPVGEYELGWMPWSSLELWSPLVIECPECEGPFAYRNDDEYLCEECRP